MTIADAKKYGTENLLESPSPALDTECFLKSILKQDKTYILFHRDLVLSENEEMQFKDFVAQRKTGLPVAYILGEKEFYGYSFHVTKDVLIPKPDTEILVENALAHIEEILAQNPGMEMKILDMCTGSGCVGTSILMAGNEKGLWKGGFPEMTMADISAKALGIAKENAVNLLGEKAGKITFVETNLFEKIPRKEFDLIVSNPPYVPKKESLELLKDGRSEPLLALDGDVDLSGMDSGTTDGLEIIRNLLSQATEYLSENGMIILETGEYNAEETARVMERQGLRHVRTYLDLEGQLRNVSGVK